MKKFVSKIFTTVSTLVLAWTILSTVEVMCENTTHNPTYSDWNCWCMLMGERTQEGTYYEDGTIVTADGHIWDYHTDLDNGTLVTVHFGTQYTFDVTDDTITHVAH